MFELRDYQSRAVDAAIGHISKSTDSCLLELATGAGKSIIVATLAEWINRKSGKKVLCLAPSKELVAQNREKYLATGNPASAWCASVGEKSMLHDVVFGSPQSVINDIAKFGDQYCAVIVDEAHGITPTIKQIVDHIKSANNRCRVIGLTATPYRMGTGYIYQIGLDDKVLPEDQAIDPYFKKLVCSVQAHELIEKGYLTKPTTTPTPTHYEAAGLKLNKMGKFNAKEVELVFTGQQRVTHEIVNQVVELTADRLGVMFFASTIQHAKEIMQSLPAGNSALVTGQLKKTERESLIKAFKAKSIKYIVNVDVLTTGFDAPHVDAIAILRATESASLLQQIVGRGLRLSEHKHDCLVMDFAENIERHGLENDLFRPTITTAKSGGESVKLECRCPLCGGSNEFTKRNSKEYADLPNDQYGYIVDLAGNPITLDDGKTQIPAHYGRRCENTELINGVFERCNYRWSFKECPSCNAENDIAARYCVSCKHELIDPNEKLRLDFKRIKEDPYSLSTDKIISWRPQLWVSQAGNTTLKVTYTTDYNTFDTWYHCDTRDPRKVALWNDLCIAVFGRVAPSVESFVKTYASGKGNQPETITVKRDTGSKFYTVYGHNRPETTLDEITRKH